MSRTIPISTERTSTDRTSIERTGMVSKLLTRAGQCVRRKRDLISLVPGNRLLLVAKLVVFGSMVPLLMRLPLSRSEKWLRPRRCPPNAPIDLQSSVVRGYLDYTDLALRLGKPITQDRCLTRSVTLYYFLTRAGMDLKIVFGAGMLEGSFAAHCWLEHDGRPFAEREDPYQVYSSVHTIPSSETTRLLRRNRPEIF